MNEQTCHTKIVAAMRECAKTDTYNNPYFVAKLLELLVDYEYYTTEQLDDLYVWSEQLYSQ